MVITQNIQKHVFSAASLLLICLSALIEFGGSPGVYVGCGYAMAVMLTLYSEGKMATIITAVAATMVVLFSVFYLHVEEDPSLVAVNHTFSVAGVMMAMFFVLYVKNIRTKAEKDDKQLNSIFSQATEGIVVANRAGEIVLVNPCAERMFGYSTNELVGSKIELLLPDALKSKHTHHRESFHQNPVNRPMGAGRDLFAARKDGTVFPVEISLSHYRMGHEAFVVAFIIDITVRKRNEKELEQQRKELEHISQEIKRLNFELEQKVEDRTMMLRETLGQLERNKNELAEALQKEKELSDLKTRFVSTVSHEFRTPLSTILSSASLIAKYPKEDEQSKRERHIERIKENVKHMSAMLEDLLSLGKLEEGLIEPKPELFAIKPFMDEFMAEMKELAKRGQIIHCETEGLEFVNSDKRLLKNILMNLVSNALKFSPDNGQVKISLSNKNGKFQISVSDEGIGISEEDQQHLFERFFRARNASNIQGTGLGLHIVSKYLELLNGKITLQSELNKGSTFTVTLPANG
jgi:PAS domain S-box-containing protein